MRTIGTVCGIALLGAVIRADDAPGDSRVKELEERVRAAEAELKKAEELLVAIRDAEKDDAAALEGVWRIVSINGNRPGGAFVKPPYDEYKIMTAGHYLWLSFKPDTGQVLRSGGGSYAVKGDQYTARVEYSNASDLKAIKGLEYKGTCRLEGSRCYHYGTMSNGAVFDELWEKVNGVPGK